jgi:hypothetical protein
VTTLKPSRRRAVAYKGDPGNRPLLPDKWRFGPLPHIRCSGIPASAPSAELPQPRQPVQMVRARPSATTGHPVVRTSARTVHEACGRSVWPEDCRTPFANIAQRPRSVRGRAPSRHFVSFRQKPPLLPCAVSRFSGGAAPPSLRPVPRVAPLCRRCASGPVGRGRSVGRCVAVCCRFGVGAPLSPKSIRELGSRVRACTRSRAGDGQCGAGLVPTRE